MLLNEIWVRIAAVGTFILALFLGVAVSARDRSADRGFQLDNIDWHDDAVALAGRDDVDIIVEMIGGSEGEQHSMSEFLKLAGIAVFSNFNVTVSMRNRKPKPKEG